MEVEIMPVSLVCLHFCLPRVLATYSRVPEDTCVVGTNLCMDLMRVEVRVKLAL